MPVSLTFDLDPDEVAALPRYPGRALHGLVYQWLALGDYRRSIDVHDDDGPRPFTIGLVRGRAGQEPRLRLTLLDDTLWSVLEAGIAKTDGVVVADCPLTLPAATRRVEATTYPDLVESATAGTRMRMAFVTPTSFRTRGMHYPLPDPRLAFQSWLMRWNLYAPAPERINVAALDVVEAHVAISHVAVRSELVDWGGNKRAVGFTGRANYLVLQPRKLGDDWLRRLDLLATYASFCGTGHKTAQGMGQTLRLG